jgi:iron complex outermembrane receptor protein
MNAFVRVSSIALAAGVSGGLQAQEQPLSSVPPNSQPVTLARPLPESKTAGTYASDLGIVSSDSGGGESDEQPVVDEPGPATAGPVSPPNMIVVTATRRETNVQDVPIPISVLSGATIAETGTLNIAQVVQIQPSLS